MGKRTGIMAKWLIQSADEVREDQGLVIEDGVIVDVAPNSKLVGMKDIEDARDCMVCPSFVNTHMHMYGILSHGKSKPAYLNELSLKPYLEAYWWPEVEDRMDQERAQITAAYGCVDMIRSGTTCFSDILEAPYAGPGVLAKEAEVVERAGMKAILSLESSERVSHENGMEALEENRSFILAQRAKSSDVRGMMCTHTAFSCSPDFLRHARQMARELGSKLQLHMSEGADESAYCHEKYGKSPAAFYADLSFWDEDVLATQCVVMDPVEIALLARYGVSVSHQPISNSGCGHGIAPVVEMLREHIKVGLGSDGNDNNMFSIMNTAGYLQRASHLLRAVLPAGELFDMATRRGAEILGFQRVGTLHPGMQADYLAVRADLPTPVNTQNAVGQLVSFRGAGDIVLVAANGQYLYRDGQVLTMDEKKVRGTLLEAAAEFWR